MFLKLETRDRTRICLILNWAIVVNRKHEPVQVCLWQITKLNLSLLYLGRFTVKM